MEGFFRCTGFEESERRSGRGPGGSSDAQYSKKVSGVPEDALVDLQMRLTFQEEEVGNLNRVIERQRLELDAVKREIARLKMLVAGLVPGQAAAQAEDPPPHY